MEWVLIPLDRQRAFEAFAHEALEHAKLNSIVIFAAPVGAVLFLPGLRRRTQRSVMNLECRSQGSILIVKLAGQLDLLNVHTFKREIETLAPEIVYIVIECEDLKQIDSAGLGALLQADSACKARNGRLILSGMPDLLRKILRLTRLDRVLVVCDTLQEALNRISSN